MSGDNADGGGRPLLSVVMPVYNEEATLETIVGSVLAADIGEVDRELVIVNDGSLDDSAAIIDRLAAGDERIRAFHQPRNMGKGAALRRAFEEVAGDFVLIQDADLEYNPSEYPVLLAPLLDGSADVVYGSRFMTGETRRVLFFWHSLGNKLITLASNMLNDMTFTDVETCYKVFRREVVDGLRISENRFGFEPEITAKISRMKPALRIYEVGISYHGRTYAEGKKIGWKDGVSAFRCILKYRFFD